MNTGIYSITSPSGGQYIGSSVNFGRRWSIHRHHLAKGTHHSAKLQAAANKYGLDALSFKAILICGADLLITYEQAAIDALLPRYNVAQKAGNTLGYRHTPETKAMLALRPRSSGNAGKRHTEATKARISAAKTGAATKREYKPLSQETRDKLRAANLGKKLGPMSDQHKAKISAARRAKA